MGGAGQDRVLGLIDELGVELFPTFVEGKSIYHRKGRSKSIAGSLPPLGLGAQLDWLQLQKRLERMAATVPVEAPWNARNAKKWDGATAGDWLDTNSVNAECKWLFNIAFKIIFGEDLHETSLLKFVHTIASCGGIDHMLGVTGGAQEPRVVGGSERIRVLMADGLGRRVILSSPVSEIDQTDDTQVIVRSAKAIIRSNGRSSPCHRPTPITSRSPRTSRSVEHCCRASRTTGRCSSLPLFTIGRSGGKQDSVVRHSPTSRSHPMSRQLAARWEQGHPAHLHGPRWPPRRLGPVGGAL
ncbi:hypothetical protein JCM18899A_38920 [Nocardioides sp. AN3]